MKFFWLLAKKGDVMECKYKTWTRGQDEALLNILGGQEVAEAILRGDKKAIVSHVVKLEPITTVKLPSVKHFSAKDAHEIKFISWSEKLDVIVEDEVPETSLSVYRLVNEPNCEAVLEQLGDKAEIKLAHLFALTERQSRGGTGVLDTKVRNLAFTRNAAGILSPIFLLWAPSIWLTWNFWFLGGDQDWKAYNWETLEKGARVLSRTP